MGRVTHQLYVLLKSRTVGDFLVRLAWRDKNDTRTDGRALGVSRNTGILRTDRMRRLVQAGKL